jgi:uncharacterized protein YjlB
MRDHEARVRSVPVEAQRLEDDGAIPNNAELPLLVYRQAVALPRQEAAAVFEALFTANGWPAAWRNGIHPFHHYHSTAHEALGVFSGRATACFGGEHGVRMTVSAGDVIIIPAGVGHKGLDASPDLGIVGAYPAGTGPDLCRGLEEERPACLRAIARVAVPDRDPLYGDRGPLREHWR